MNDTVNDDALASVVTMLDAANDLKQLPRMGWLLAGVANAESVAAHAYATTVLALALAQAINQAPASQGLTSPLAITRVLQIALLHDLAESIVTDLPKRATETLGEDAKHAAERAAWQQLAGDSALLADWALLWQEYESGATPEARLVRDVDKLEMIHQALRYTESGNRRLKEFLDDRAWAYPVSSRLRQTLLARAQDRSTVAPLIA